MCQRIYAHNDYKEEQGSKQTPTKRNSSSRVVVVVVLVFVVTIHVLLTTALSQRYNTVTLQM